ncbi:hypothetical protein [Oceanimonas baumannii]|uniref:hypothetical protein n=1 Tax=Oceanimonas baumannii TaxID=129578 RepID=UPI003A8D4E16
MNSPKLLTKEAAQNFMNGNYEVAYNIYKKAESLLGPENVKANILLCQKRLNKSDKSIKHPFPYKNTPTNETNSTNQEVERLKKELNKKDIEITKRFEELAILTKLLENK